MSAALKDWRSEINDVTDAHPYGTEWDILMVGQYQEVITHIF
jgi:hypothetical protein